MKNKQQLFADMGLRPCHLSRETQKWETSAQAARALIAFAEEGAPVDGWLTLQSQVVLVRDGVLYCPIGPGKPFRKQGFSDLPGLGTPVNGELARGGTSLQCHFDGSRWVMIRLTETEGETYWRDRVIHLGDFLKAEPATHVNLHYHRYWKNQEGMRPFAARLTALKNEEFRP